MDEREERNTRHIVMRHTYAFKSLQVKSTIATQHSTFTIWLNIFFNSNVYLYTKNLNRISINGDSMVQNSHFEGPVCDVPAVAYTLAQMA